MAAYAFGILMNLSGWPFLLGVAVPARPTADSPSCPAPRWPRTSTASRYYTLLTSTGCWDTGRAITTSVAIIVLGPAVLHTLRRAPGARSWWSAR